MTRSEALNRLRVIVEGIDKTEAEQAWGWWETPGGAEFGQRKLRELEELIGMIYDNRKLRT